MKTALLSNVNTDYVNKIIAKELETVPPIGYGDVWGQLLNPESVLNKENPEVIIIIPDIDALLDGRIREAEAVVNHWFEQFDSVLKKDKEYFVPGIVFRNTPLSDADSACEACIVGYWMELLKKRLNDNVNVHYLDICERIEREGKNVVFSNKLWYMGKIPYTNSGTELVARSIIDNIRILSGTPRKVLVLDLDNTLWGGVLGELGVDGISLSGDHIGAIYRDVQLKIRQIKDSGVLLAIASKNNESDVQEVWDKHPHMILKKDDFVSIKINWKDKADNIKEIATELNLGVDSFVFIDDMAPERENISMRLPGVAVPDFPEKIEDYPRFIEELFDTYFKKLRLSSEDKKKTQQYIENKKRSEAAEGLSYEDFLTALELVVERVELDDAKLDRIVQLHGKTNQFNLTTMRYSRKDIEQMVEEGYRIYAYNVKDKYGDYGLVAVAIVDMSRHEINSFLMSCRVMGKLIENFVIDNIETDLEGKGIKTLKAKYIPTEKNKPVADLFEGLGYTVIHSEGGKKEYEINLSNRPERKFFVKEM